MRESEVVVDVGRLKVRETTTSRDSEKNGGRRPHAHGNVVAVYVVVLLLHNSNTYLFDSTSLLECVQANR